MLFATPWNRLTWQGGRLCQEGDIGAETRMKINNQLWKEIREERSRHKEEWYQGFKVGMNLMYSRNENMVKQTNIQWQTEWASCLRWVLPYIYTHSATHHRQLLTSCEGKWSRNLCPHLVRVWPCKDEDNPGLCAHMPGMKLRVGEASIVQYWMMGKGLDKIDSDLTGPGFSSADFLIVQD